MIFAPRTIADLRAIAFDVVIVGAGPLGLISALRLEKRGLRVLVLDSGGSTETAAGRGLSRADIRRPEFHGPAEINAARRVGGTSHLWGGRCIPYDETDFDHRPDFSGSAWPIAGDALDPYYDDVCAFFAAGKPVFTDPIDGLAPADPDFRVDALERWAGEPDSMVRHGRHLRRSRSITIAEHVTVTGFDAAGDTIGGLEVCIGAQPDRHILPAPWIVLSAGGNESLRLLLAFQQARPDAFGGRDGPLGRYYMGHLRGCVADIVIDEPVLERNLDFYVDCYGAYVRRIFVPSTALIRREDLLNISFWPVVPEVHDPRHRSGLLSAAFLALSVGPIGRRLVAERIRRDLIGEPPFDRRRHVANIIRDLPRTLRDAPRFLWRRKVATPRLPGFFIFNRASRYGLKFQSEQWPNPESRIRLSRETDQLGLPRLDIDFFYSRRDAESVVKAHDLLAGWLEGERLGRIEYRYPRRDLADRVLQGASDGTHQIGTMRMAASAATGVVDPNCVTFSFGNLYVASTGVMPTSGRANPTFSAAALALRAADHLADRLRSRPHPTPIAPATGT